MRLRDRAKLALGLTPAVAVHVAADSLAANALAASPHYAGGPGILSNLLSGMNTSADSAWWDVWYQRRTLSDTQRKALGQDPLVSRILTLPGQDATREGWTVQAQGDDRHKQAETAKKIKDYEDRESISLALRLQEANARARQYGAALIWLGIDDGQTPDQPVDKTKIKRIWWATVIDRRDFEYKQVIGPRGEIQDYRTLTDREKDTYAPGATRFGQVYSYRITDLNGVLPDGVRYGDGAGHGPAETQLLQFGDYVVHADRVLYLPYGAHAMPLLDQLQDALAAYFRAMGGISRAIDRASLIVLKIANHVAQSWSANHAIGERRLRSAMQSWSQLAAMVLDSKDEDVAPIATGSATGLGDAIAPIEHWLCAASGIPHSRLFGDGPDGFSDGSAMRDNYDDECRSLQTLLTPLVRMFAIYAMAAQDGGIGQVVEPDTIAVDWADLRSPTESEQAEIFSKKATAVGVLIDKGVLLESEAIQLFPEIPLDVAARELRAARGQVAGAMTVGVFNGLLQMLLEGGSIPPAQKRALAMLSDPARVTSESATALFPDPKPEDIAATATAAIPAAPLDTDDARTLARELRIPARRLSLAVERGQLRNYDLLGGKPRYSRAEVMEVIRLANLTPEERAAEELEAAAEAADAVAPTTEHDRFVGEHAIRQRDPDDFVASSFRRKTIAKGIDLIAGKLKSDPDGPMVVQSYRFDSELFTPSEAKAWAESHELARKTVEPAKSAAPHLDDLPPTV
jgi:phage-related protein (TIGR01555 family)